MKLSCKVITIITWLVATGAYAVQEVSPWSAMFYYGATAKETFGQILGTKFSRKQENIYAVEVAYSLSTQNILSRFFSPIFNTLQIAAELAYRQNYRYHAHAAEANFYFVGRFTNFPWRESLPTVFAFGDGISVASRPLYADCDAGVAPHDVSQCLNYLLVELGFSLPRYPQFELALRLHHRCTAWGVYPKKANAGSTAVGIALRYRFT